jgi:hypothetical protein
MKSLLIVFVLVAAFFSESVFAANWSGDYQYESQANAECAAYKSEHTNFAALNCMKCPENGTSIMLKQGNNCALTTYGSYYYGTAGSSAAAEVLEWCAISNCCGLSS